MSRTEIILQLLPLFNIKYDCTPLEFKFKYFPDQVKTSLIASLIHHKTDFTQP